MKNDQVKVSVRNEEVSGGKKINTRDIIRNPRTPNICFNLKNVMGSKWWFFGSMISPSLLKTMSKKILDLFYLFFLRCFLKIPVKNRYPTLLIDFNEPGRPKENVYIESFNGKFRDEFLHKNLFFAVHRVRERIENWRTDYNSVHPHSSLDNMTPEAFALRKSVMITTFNSEELRYCLTQ